MLARLDPVPLGRPSFLGAPRCTTLDLLDADLAAVGIPYTTPHDLAQSKMPSSDAPRALREQSERLADRLHHYDFDFGGDLLAGRRLRIVDCGDVAGTPGQYEENNRVATATVRAVLDGRALPIVLGGDHAAIIPALRAYAGSQRICVVHLGADLAWRDDVNGVRDGLHSAMRRVSEMPWVASMIQVGLRGSGSARQQEVDAAAAFGSIRVRAEELHRVGADDVLRRVPDAPGYYVSLDASALDPAIAPAVDVPAFGGLDYFEVTNLLKGIAARGGVVGFALVGIVPANDLREITSLLGVRLILNLVGALAHAERIGTPGVHAAPRADARALEPVKS